jgi:hypothetical protein
MKQRNAGGARAFKTKIDVHGAVLGKESLGDLPQIHRVVDWHLDSKDGEGDAGDSQAVHHSFKHWNPDEKVFADSNVGMGAGLAVPHVVQGVVESGQEVSLKELDLTDSGTLDEQLMTANQPQEQGRGMVLAAAVGSNQDPVRNTAMLHEGILQMYLSVRTKQLRKLANIHASEDVIVDINMDKGIVPKRHAGRWRGVRGMWGSLNIRRIGIWTEIGQVSKISKKKFKNNFQKFSKIKK